jgi:hypothetical protein
VKAAVGDFVVAYQSSDPALRSLHSLSGTVVTGS